MAQKNILDILAALPSDRERKRYLADWKREDLTHLMQRLDPNGVWLDSLSRKAYGSLATKTEMVTTLLEWSRDV